MREKHPFFDTDIKPDTVLWRYMDFAKFVSLLANKALWFSRADLLGDPLEGSFTQAYEVQQQELLTHPPGGKTSTDVRRDRMLSQTMTHHSRRSVYVNCWHIGEHESMALWRGYGDGPYAVAVSTTFCALNSVLPECISTNLETPTPILLGRVRYVDHSSTTHQIDSNDLLAQFVCKSIVYAHERELRAAFWGFGIRHDAPLRLEMPIGHLVSIDLQALISTPDDG